MYRSRHWREELSDTETYVKRAKEMGLPLGVEQFGGVNRYTDLGVVLDAQADLRSIYAGSYKREGDERIAEALTKAREAVGELAQAMLDRGWGRT